MSDRPVSSDAVAGAGGCSREHGFHRRGQGPPLLAAGPPHRAAYSTPAGVPGDRDPTRSRLETAAPPRPSLGGPDAARAPAPGGGGAWGRLRNLRRPREHQDRERDFAGGSHSSPGTGDWGCTRQLSHPDPPMPPTPHTHARRPSRDAHCLRGLTQLSHRTSPGAGPHRLGPSWGPRGGRRPRVEVAWRVDTPAPLLRAPCDTPSLWEVPGKG